MQQKWPLAYVRHWGVDAYMYVSEKGWYLCENRIILKETFWSNKDYYRNFDMLMMDIFVMMDVQCWNSKSYLQWHKTNSSWQAMKTRFKKKTKVIQIIQKPKKKLYFPKHHYRKICISIKKLMIRWMNKRCVSLYHQTWKQPWVIIHFSKWKLFLSETTYKNN